MSFALQKMDNNKPELAAIHLQEKYEVPGTSDDVSMHALNFFLILFMLSLLLLVQCIYNTTY